MNKVFHFFVAMVSVLFFSVSLQAKDTIKIGAILAVTGPASFLGDPELKTLQMRIAEINKQGGVLGKKLELVHYDNGANPKKAVTFVKRLINQDKVDAIIGASASGDSLAIMPFVQKAKIPMVSLGGSIKIVEPAQSYVFKTPATDRMACQKIYEYLEAKGKTKIALISGNGGFGKSMRAQCKDVASDYGIIVLADETYGAKDTDMSSQLTKIKNTKGVQAVVNPGFGQGPIIVTKNFKQLGLKQLLVQSHGVASDTFIKLTGESGEGVLVASPPILVANLLKDSNPIKKMTLGYVHNYETKYDEPVSTFGGYAYDALGLIVEAMKTAKSTNKTKVRNALEKTSGFAGVNGIFDMSKKDHLGIDIDTGIKILAIEKGDWKIAN